MIGLLLSLVDIIREKFSLTMIGSLGRDNDIPSLERCAENQLHNRLY